MCCVLSVSLFILIPHHTVRACGWSKLRHVKWNIQVQQNALVPSWSKIDAIVPSDFFGGKFPPQKKSSLDKSLIINYDKALLCVSAMTYNKSNSNWRHQEILKIVPQFGNVAFVLG